MSLIIIPICSRNYHYSENYYLELLPGTTTWNYYLELLCCGFRRISLAGGEDDGIGAGGSGVGAGPGLNQLLAGLGKWDGHGSKGMTAIE
jgi:hypothetical protein